MFTQKFYIVSLKCQSFVSTGTGAHKLVFISTNFDAIVVGMYHTFKNLKENYF